ncbi:cation diffusion facilitator family protein, putative [Plasmodium ovale]|uniref:Cation diffusion facilitator family protein, putative n=1 Tax=Plasmodium ovale TaxID=36330 RepID=A0A1C3L4X6_PLAOA|nr:cation diffusion facilitator family protein, putative [Plasmodium ovale]
MGKLPLEKEANMNFVERMSHMYDNTQKKATKKLIVASIICIIFMIIEIIAAIISNSLSLMTDASHLFCDLLSFGLNLFSIYVSTFEGNVDMSFGYHRAEIIGALFSIFFIWALSAYILYSAVFRLFDVQTVDGYIMFVTAFVSTLANIFIAFVLKVHSHGFEFIGQKRCSHSDGSHDHTHISIWENNPKGQSKTRKYKNINSDIILADNDSSYNHNISIDKMNTSSCSYVAFDYYENVNNANTSNYYKVNEGGGDITGDVSDGRRKETNNSLNLSKNKINTSHVGNNEDVDGDGNFKVGINDHIISNEHAYAISKGDCEENVMCDSLDGHLVETNVYDMHDGSHGHQSAHQHSHDRQHHGNEEINSISLKTAYLHAISDLLQNIGVMIASLIIWYNPKYSITDPICSIIFCFIVFSTTISVIKEILNVLMEGTPVSINLIDIKNDLLKIPGVIDVHDLHVWSLSIGKPALACHIVAHKKYSHTVLNNATLLCQNKYKILHTTVQTDYPSNISNCETYAHLKCSNLKTETQK